MPDSALLNIDRLTISFGENEVVHSVDFSLQQGEILAIVGESGSGKSVTCSAIAGLLPRGGRITEGRCTHGPSGECWATAEAPANAPLGKGLSLVFQDPMSSLNPSMRVGWQVAETALVHRQCSKSEARTHATALLKEVELPEPEMAFEKYPHEMSGGQKQRVMIALALAANPEVLIADEPTTALDTTVQKSILALLKKVQQHRQMGVIFITHDLDVVHAIANRVLVMQNGRIVESGDVNAVLEQPSHPYTQSLLSARDMERFQQNTPSGTVLVRAVNASKWYGDFCAVHDVNLSIDHGERVGLIGESGSGKSTLGRMLIGMLPASSGTITFGKEAVEPANRSSMARIRRRAQLVFQDPYAALNPKLTVKSALEEVLLHSGVKAQEATKRAHSLLEEVGLEASDAAKYPREFSGGQRQRIAIARALAMEPEFVVLDESVAALDVQIQRDVLGLLDRIGRERGLTYLLISHDLDVVASFCNRLVILEKGRVVEAGETEEIMQHPSTEYTLELLGSRPKNLR
ncbi:MAG: ABC transporter ATP-binding protein [Flavobacteriales bacterium]|nr:ABC transporter ATP-binding protein [Flavobacteriales bacterium]